MTLVIDNIAQSSMHGLVKKTLVIGILEGSKYLESILENVQLISTAKAPNEL